MFISAVEVKFPSGGYYTARENVKPRAIYDWSLERESELTGRADCS